MFDFILSQMSLIWIFVFYLNFLPRRLKFWKTVFLFVACTVVCVICSYFLILQNGSAGANIANILLQGMLIQFLVYGICKYHDGRAVFVGLTGAAYVLFGGVIGLEAYVWSGCFLAGILIAAAMHLFVFLILYFKLRRAFLSQLDREDSIWIKLCIIPLLFYVLVYSITIWPADVHEHPENLLGIFLLILLMFTSYIILFGAMDGYERYQKQKNDIELMEKYADGIRQQLEIMRVNDEKNAILRHDIKHHAMVLLGYLRNGEYHKLKEAMEGTLSRFEELKVQAYCENVAVNSIVTQYAKQARKGNVLFNCEMDVPSELPVDEVEFAVVLSNLLSNAVREAGADAGQPGVVRIFACRVKGQLAVEISNTFTNEVEFGEDHLPISKRGEGHGYGSRSVLAFVRKYGAVYDYQLEDGFFTVRLALYLMKH
ncbi:MAG: GHKL domain-containing protein [Lachnospiraceae bacterium]|nr:GHKL domain-containing protein [Lachnospiraceae bacterium]